MKGIARGLFALSFVVGPGALAADMPIKAPPAPVPTALSWMGFYLGAGGGYGSWSDPKSSEVAFLRGFPNPYDLLAAGGKGGFGTVILGYDYQIGDHWVAGAYADFDLASIDGTLQDMFNEETGTRRLQHAWYAGARLGYLLMPSSLLYGTGGYTAASFSGTTLNVITGPPFSPGIDSLPGNSPGGWFAGGGIETQIAQGWSIRGEYRYANYGSVNLTAANSGAIISLHPTVQTFRVDLVYKIGQQKVAVARSAPPSSWTGFYIGAGAGYGSWEDRHASVVGFPGGGAFIDIPASGKGGFVSPIAGYDYEFADRAVAGVYTDYDFARLSGYVNNHSATTSTPFTEKDAWFAGGRLGYLVMPSSLAYLTGGYTQSHFSAGTTVLSFDGGASPPDQLPGRDFSGWYLGGGLEAAIDRNWSVRGEYRYADYGQKILPEATSGLSIVLHPSVQTFRLDLIYKFGSR